MLSDKQIDRMLSKLKKFEDVLSPLLFVKEDEVCMGVYEVKEPLNQVPKEIYKPINKGDTWGSECSYWWFSGGYKVPERLAGKTLYVYPKVEGYESMLWVNGEPFGTFCTKIVVTGHGNHYCNMLKKDASAGEVIELAIECYTGHFVIGCDPWNKDFVKSYRYVYESVDICTKNEEISDFYFDLKTLNQMATCLDRNSFRRADIIKTLTKLHSTLFYSKEDATEEEFMSALREAVPLLKEQLLKKNSETTPFAGFIGHSHMDTAWLWHIDETVKKCARTYSNEINLMEQYPEYTFIQSSAYHSEMIRSNYPELFERIKMRVLEGRYEPNGGVWIECDCNITSGESMIRQFLWGQRFTRKHFNYTSNCFWLPDTFGYSASIPQIMKGCKVDYFLTTKMSWNDTTDFPYDTFYWKGIDGTKVLTHLNKSHIWPDPVTMMDYVVSGGDSIKEKSASNKRLLSYGFGDGGGGPQFEMIEMSRRVKDLEGLPKSNHVLVGDFMKELEKDSEYLSVHNGELYLELHRGTLTNQHVIKRNNRLAEKKLRDLEYFTVRKAFKAKEKADAKDINPLMCTLLVNQFHDILPGTCITRAHEESKEATSGIIRKADEFINRLLKDAAQEEEITLTKESKTSSNIKMTAVNTLSFERKDVIYLKDVEGLKVKGNYRQQRFIDMDGTKKLAIAGVSIPSLASVVLEMEEGGIEEGSSFKREGNNLETPLALVTFDEKGYISSYIDKQAGREIRGEGYSLNTFLIAEDMPNYWDNWDIDADIELKFKDKAGLVSSIIAGDGMVEHRIRNTYKLSEKSDIVQDMIFYADSLEVRFETRMNWNDDRRFLKTAFDVSIQSDFVRQEIQFGHLKRTTSRNTPAEKAKFEVCNHKYSDLSETRYGTAILNDCKYGISVEDSKMRLSLHKGGLRPDYKGDKGLHECIYSFYPHHGGFSTNTVIQPAYMLNYPVHTVKGALSYDSFIRVEADNIIIETLKPCEDAENALILRLYEAEGTYTKTIMSPPDGTVKIYETDMLEEDIRECNGIKPEFIFRPFEIKTIKVLY